jgi:agmatinase
MREAVPLVRLLCAQKKVVGFELLDPAPILDLSFKSAQNANYILHSCLAGMAQRKATERN